MLFALVFVGCKDDDDPAPATITLSAGNTALEGKRGERIAVSLSLSASAGIQSLTVAVDGGSPEAVTVNAGQTSQTVNYDFGIPGAAELGKAFSLLFTLTDVDAKQTQTTVTVTTVALIDLPTTYEFTRNGSTTVSFPVRQTA